MSNSQPLSSPSDSKPSSPVNLELTDVKLDETFYLIEQVIPLKSCQHYQLLPVSVENNCLTLAMVNPQDQKAKDHLQLLLAPFNYTVTIEHIDQQTHQIILSSYLNYSRALLPDEKATHPQEKEEELETEIKLADEPEMTAPPASEEEEQDSVESERELTVSHYQNQELSKLGLSHAPASSEIEAHYLSAPAQFLTTLSPPQIWRELLARVLLGGIGRLYFEQKMDYGRILWSQDGVLKFSINQIECDVFQGILKEVKHLAHLPPNEVTKVTKVEIEKYYYNDRFLFRLRLTPGKYGEEGNLQVLRGKALHFYQQRQMNEMGNQALKVAQQLERKLRQIRARKKINPTPVKQVDQIYEALDNIKRQLKLLEE